MKASDITPELLGLVLDEEVTHIFGVEHNILTYEINYNDVYNDNINLDTLTRKMKEWIKPKGYCINILDRNNGLLTLTLSYGIDFDYEESFSVKKGIHTDNDLIELEAVIKATEFVAKERNLI